MRRSQKYCYLCLMLFLAFLNGCNSDKDCWKLLDEVKANREIGELSLARQQLMSLSSCLEDNDEPKGMRFYYHLGWLHHEYGEFDQAVDAYTQGLEFQPDYAFAYWRRGLAFESWGKVSSAQDDYRQAMDVGMKTLPNEFLSILDQHPEIKAKLMPHYQK